MWAFWREEIDHNVLVSKLCHHLFRKSSSREFWNQSQIEVWVMENGRQELFVRLSKTFVHELGNGFNSVMVWINLRNVSPVLVDPHSSNTWIDWTSWIKSIV